MQEELDNIKSRVDSLEEQDLLVAEELVEIRESLDNAVRLLAAATANQNTLMKDSKELLEIYRGFKTTVKVFGIIENIAVWIAKVAAAAGLCWAIFKYGVMEVFSSDVPKKPGG